MDGYFPSYRAATPNPAITLGFAHLCMRFQWLLEARQTPVAGLSSDESDDGDGSRRRRRGLELSYELRTRAGEARAYTRLAGPFPSARAEMRTDRRSPPPHPPPAHSAAPDGTSVFSRRHGRAAVSSRARARSTSRSAPRTAAAIGGASVIARTASLIRQRTTCAAVRASMIAISNPVPPFAACCQLATEPAGFALRGAAVWWGPDGRRAGAWPRESTRARHVSTCSSASRPASSAAASSSLQLIAHSAPRSANSALSMIASGSHDDR